MRVRLWDFLYAAFALVVVSFVRVAGVLLTFDLYLIVPAVCGITLGRLEDVAVVRLGHDLTASLLGLTGSYWLDSADGRGHRGVRPAARHRVR
jgi:ABC-type Mn2+/Zn2+ transport system permease subunit